MTGYCSVFSSMPRPPSPRLRAVQFTLAVLIILKITKISSGYLHVPHSSIQLRCSNTYHWHKPKKMLEVRALSRRPSPAQLDVLEIKEITAHPVMMMRRKDWLTTLFGSSMAALFLLAVPANKKNAAHAAYGDDARIELPNPVQAWSDRTTKQCLVETLGNRECLVYLNDDAGSFLYQGADTSALLVRLQNVALPALARVPEHIAQRQWLQITSVLAGPLGDTVRVMTQMANTETTHDTMPAVQQFKTDLYALQGRRRSQAGRRGALQYHAAATRDLLAFVKLFVV